LKGEKKKKMTNKPKNLAFDWGGKGILAAQIQPGEGGKQEKKKLPPPGRLTRKLKEEVPSRASFGAGVSRGKKISKFWGKEWTATGQKL